DSRRQLVRYRLERDPGVGERRYQFLEPRTLGGLERVDVVHGLDANQRAVPLVVARSARFAEDVIAGTQAKLLDEPRRDDDAASVVLQQGLLQEAVAIGRDLEVPAHQTQALLLR